MRLMCVNFHFLFTCLLGEVFMGASEGHLSETDGDLTTNGWGRSDSDMAGEILDCMGAISAAPVPVIGPHRGSRITEKNRCWIGSKGKYSVNVSGAINNISVEKKTLWEPRKKMHLHTMSLQR